MSNSVRLARTSDIDAIADVQVRAWRQAYARVLPAHILSALDPSEMAFEWGRALLSGEAHRVFVAVAEGSGAIVGAASVGPAADPDLEGSAIGEIGALFVDPDHQRAGHGSRLMHAAIDMLLGAGVNECVTWIALDDEPRRAFFVSAGWGPDSAFRDLQLPTDPDSPTGTSPEISPETSPEITTSNTTIREVRLTTTLN